MYPSSGLVNPEESIVQSLDMISTSYPVILLELKKTGKGLLFLVELWASSLTSSKRKGHWVLFRSLRRPLMMICDCVDQCPHLVNRSGVYLFLIFLLPITRLIFVVQVGPRNQWNACYLNPSTEFHSLRRHWCPFCENNNREGHSRTTS